MIRPLNIILALIGCYVAYETFMTVATHFIEAMR